MVCFMGVAALRLDEDRNDPAVGERYELQYAKSQHLTETGHTNYKVTCQWEPCGVLRLFWLFFRCGHRVRCRNGSICF